MKKKAEKQKLQSRLLRRRGQQLAGVLLGLKRLMIGDGGQDQDMGHHPQHIIAMSVKRNEQSVRRINK